MTIHIDGALCKGCGLCVHYCPKDVLVIGQETNSKGYDIAGVDKAEQCIKCLLCEIYCPDLAIFVDKM